MQNYFYRVADALQSLLRGGEVFTAAFDGEQTDFVRFNHAKLRQAGRVSQQSVNVDLIAGKHHAAGQLRLSGAWEQDRARLRALLAELREIRASVPEDPYLLYATEVCSGEALHPSALPAAAQMTAHILEAADGLDMVGIFASGPTHNGFANSFGQRNWSTRHSFNFDWSLHLRADKAVKARYAGFVWDEAELQQKMQQASEQLAVMQRPAQRMPPGAYRAYLTPMALEEIADLLGWGGFSLRAQRTGTTPLLRMVDEGARLHPGVSLRENTAEGVAPDFQQAGFIRPPQVDLIANGVYKNSLVSPRSAAEYGVPGNGASDFEGPLSLDMAAGHVPMDEVLATLGRGLYIGNLWYLNYSDRNAARITGMTRFATFWVEGGEIQAPVEVLRFDDSLYSLLGDQLIGLTRERELLLDPSSYGGRSSHSARLPGALVDGMRFTL